MRRKGPVTAALYPPAVPPSAVYAAEDQWSALMDRGGTVDFFGSRIDLPTQRRFGDIGSIRQYVDAVLALGPVVDQVPDAGPVAVRERSGQTRAHYEPGTCTIAIPVRTMWAARESVILHEIAHHLACGAMRAGSRRAWHGPDFRRTLCALVEAVMGEQAALVLRAGYEAAGLRTVTSG